ncbi:MAG TPA: arylsulfatase [Acetobacteraceae bacterium]|nr:arylsulfatase [Acetobacteraceae bacterium]
MAHEKRGRLDRRSLLAGMAVGGGLVAALAAAGDRLRQMQRRFTTPKPVEAGAAPEIALSFADSHPAYGGPARAPAGAPNIVAIILDDVGFSDLGCYGSEIPTPHIDALAQAGLRYANFRTTAMCSPTRAAFQTGLNHHSAGMGWLADIDSGYPGYRGDLTHEAATLGETLRDAGWSTFLVGKWHLNNAVTTGATGPYDNWPTQRGFERAYWFQGHSTDYFKPSELFDGVAPLEPPAAPDYYVMDDLTDKAIAYIDTQHAMAPEKPFFLTLAYPGAHSPLQARGRERDRFKGKYDSGWDEIRAARLARQRDLNIVPKNTVLPPLSFGADPWDSLTPEQKHLYARYMEVYAAIIASLDSNVGRLMDALDRLGVRDNTLVLIFSDNGASPEGSPTGTPNIFATAFMRPVPLDQATALYDIMGEEGTFPHYPMGWACASNTPYRKYKQYVHLGGVADPMVVHWPASVTDHGAIRHQFVHVVDLFPTLLEAAGVARPATYQGHRQKPLEGASAFATFHSSSAPTRTEQYYELGGMRSYESGTWRLTAEHSRGEPFENDHWALYDMSREANELTDLSAQHPDIAATVKAKWDAAAARYNVLPLDDRALIIKMVQDRQRRGVRAAWDLRPPIERMAHDVAPQVCGLDHSIEIELDRPEGGNGVLLAGGSKYAGYVLYIHDNRLRYETSLIPWVERIEAADPLPTGALTIRYEQAMVSRPFDGSGKLFVNGSRVAEKKFDRCLMAISYDGVSVGEDTGNQVSTAYAGPNKFQGTITRVQIRVQNRQASVLEMARFMREMTWRQ